jgi:rhodanese-related sulfurtransferase
MKTTCLRNLLFGLLSGILSVLPALSYAAAPTSATEPVQVSVSGGSYTNVTPARLKQMLAAKDFLLVNVHIPYEGEIAPTDAFIPYDEVERNQSKFPPDKGAKIFLYCRSGRMSAIAAEKLVQLGYANVWNLQGRNGRVGGSRIAGCHSETALSRTQLHCDAQFIKSLSMTAREEMNHGMVGAELGMGCDFCPIHWHALVRPWWAWRPWWWG